MLQLRQPVPQRSKPYPKFVHTVRLDDAQRKSCAAGRRRRTVGTSAGLGVRRNYSANTSRMTSGRLAAMVSKAWAAPDGLRRPCSHS